MVGDLRVQIDRDICVGFGDCAAQAPDAFQLDGDGLAEFATPEQTPRDTLLRACDACPVDAIFVWDQDGRQLVP
jgi:ferredoxin